MKRQSHLFRNHEQTLCFLNESSFSNFRYEGRIKMIKDEDEKPIGFTYNRLDEEVDNEVQLFRKYLTEDENTDSDLIMFENLTWGLEEADLMQPGYTDFSTEDDTKYHTGLPGGSLTECDDEDMLNEDVEQYKYNDLYGAGETADEEIDMIDNRHSHSKAKPLEESDDLDNSFVPTSANGGNLSAFSESINDICESNITMFDGNGTDVNEDEGIAHDEDRLYEKYKKNRNVNRNEIKNILQNLYEKTEKKDKHKDKKKDKKKHKHDKKKDHKKNDLDKFYEEDEDYDNQDIF